MDAILNVGSVTAAQKARQLLKKAGIFVEITRTRTAGCGYAVRVREEKKVLAAALLKEGGVRVKP